MSRMNDEWIKRNEAAVGIERRFFEADEIRAEAEEGKAAKIVGHAAVFNRMSEDLGWFREKIAPGTFTKAIERDDVRALMNHDPNLILGRNKQAKTLRLNEDSRGLLVEIDPPDTSYARDLIVSIQRRDVTQMSFGFQTIRDEWDMSDAKNPIRTLLEVKLFDVSPVTFPAYPDTDLAARSFEAATRLVAPQKRKMLWAAKAQWFRTKRRAV